jgi:integrase
MLLPVLSYRRIRSAGTSYGDFGGVRQQPIAATTTAKLPQGRAARPVKAPESRQKCCLRQDAPSLVLEHRIELRERHRPIARIEPRRLIAEVESTDVDFQALRRTCATLFGANAKDPRDTQVPLRHADPSVTLRYYQKSIPASVRAAVLALDAELISRKASRFDQV